VADSGGILHRRRLALCRLLIGPSIVRFRSLRRWRKVADPLFDAIDVRLCQLFTERHARLQLTFDNPHERAPLGMPFYNSATVFGAPGEERFKRGNGESAGLDPLGVALRTVGYQQRQDGAFN